MPSRFPVLRRGTEWEGLTRDEIVALVQELFTQLLIDDLADVDTTGVQNNWTLRWSASEKSWVVASVGSGAGTTDHTELDNRDASDQHTIGSITGLQAALDAATGGGAALPLVHVLVAGEFLLGMGATDYDPGVSITWPGAQPEGTLIGVWDTAVTGNGRLTVFEADGDSATMLASAMQPTATATGMPSGGAIVPVLVVMQDVLDGDSPTPELYQLVKQNAGAQWGIAALTGADAGVELPIAQSDVTGLVAALAAKADAVDIPDVSGLQDTSEKGQPDGYAGLDSGGKLATSTLPTLSITDSFPVDSQAEMLDLTAQRGDLAIRSDLPATFVLAGDDPTDLADWLQLPSGIGSVLSVNGQTDVVVLVAADVGAATSAQGDTADSALQPGDPISSVVWTDSLGNFGAPDTQYDGQTTFDLVLDGIATVIQEVINAALAVDGNLADVADPAAALANIGGLTESEITGLVTAAIDALLDGAPAALNTLNELAAAIADDASFAASVTTALAGRQPLNSNLTDIAALTTTTFGRSLLALVDAAAARTALGLGTAATSASSAFATAAQGALADSAVQSDGSVTQAVKVTQAAYDLLTPDPTTVYFIVEP